MRDGDPLREELRKRIAQEVHAQFSAYRGAVNFPARQDAAGIAAGRRQRSKDGSRSGAPHSRLKSGSGHRANVSKCWAPPKFVA